MIQLYCTTEHCAAGWRQLTRAPTADACSVMDRQIAGDPVLQAHAWPACLRFLCSLASVSKHILASVMLSLRTSPPYGRQVPRPYLGSTHPPERKTL